MTCVLRGLRHLLKRPLLEQDLVNFFLHHSFAMSSNKGPLYLTREDVQKCLTGRWDSIIQVVEKALSDFSSGSVIQPVRSAVPIDQHGGLLLTMPAYSSKDDSLAVKLVSIYPGNKEKNLPSIQATILLYDTQTGSLKAIMDGETITNMRTAAASAVATKYLAKANPSVLAIIGAGNQARSHYEVLTHMYKFSEVRVYNITSESASKLVSEMVQDGVNAKQCSTVQEAVRNADIIVTVTLSETPILEKDWVKDGAHINAVGAPVPTWQELDEDLMRSSLVYVDSKEGALAESGDIIKSKAQVFAEVGEVVNKTKPAHTDKTTIFKSLGMAVEDVVTAKLVLEIYNQGKSAE